jgi:hypothetical protein
VYDLKRLFDKQLDKVDQTLDMPERVVKAAKLLDKMLGTDAWRAESQLPEVEFLQVDVLTDKPLSTKEINSLYTKVYKLLREEGLSQKDDTYVVDRLEQAECEEDDVPCDCYECTPCDCEACRKQNLLGRILDYVAR